jgi:hypothetical protein
VRLVEADPSTIVEIDVASGFVRYGEDRVPCSLPCETSRALIDGRWDPIVNLLAQDAAIHATARRLEYLGWAGDDVRLSATAGG